MFIFFETSIDFNVLKSPSGKWFKHLIGEEYGGRICPFGKVAIFALIFIFIARHYIIIPKWFINMALIISFVLSLTIMLTISIL